MLLQLTRTCVDPGELGQRLNDVIAEWGSRETKPRGRALLNALATLDVLLLNTGSKPTFVGEQGESVIDLTFAGVSLFNRVESWQVSDIYTSSDHKAIVYEILLEENQGVGRAPAGNRRWSARSFDGDSFAEIVSGMEIRSGFAEDMVDELMSTITRACDDLHVRSALSPAPRVCLLVERRHRGGRRDCIPRAKVLPPSEHAARPDEVIRREEFANARRRLRDAIKVSKRLCWRQLCDEADRD
ncbi:unnamed protein product, partial [Trichogramma brassicae]